MYYREQAPDTKGTQCWSGDADSVKGGLRPCASVSGGGAEELCALTIDGMIKTSIDRTYVRLTASIHGLSH